MVGGQRVVGSWLFVVGCWWCVGVVGGVIEGGGLCDCRCWVVGGGWLAYRWLVLGFGWFLVGGGWCGCTWLVMDGGLRVVWL